MFYTRVVTKAALNTQRKSISTTVRKEPETSYGLIHHFLKLLKPTLQNHFSDYWINIFQSLINHEQHNRNVSNKKQKQTNLCNCRNKNECPLNGNCKVQMLSTNVLYLQHKHSNNVSN